MRLLPPHVCELAAAGDLQAVLVSNPEVAAAVAEICMVGLATTAQATKGPPKPDKARIDRLAYVVSEPPPEPLRLLSTFRVIPGQCSRT